MVCGLTITIPVVGYNVFHIGYRTVGYVVWDVLATVVGYCPVEHQMVCYCRGKALVRGTWYNCTTIVLGVHCSRLVVCAMYVL